MGGVKYPETAQEVNQYVQNDFGSAGRLKAS